MDIIKKLKGNGQVKNYSNVPLLIVENDIHGKAVAWVLGPMMKTDVSIDADGFKRVDGKAIKGHKNWWKIWGHVTAKISGNDFRLKVKAIAMFASPEKEFGEVTYTNEPIKSQPIRNIIDVEKDKNHVITKCKVEGIGWVTKIQAIKMTIRDEIDNAVVIYRKWGDPYLRSKPDDRKDNNFSSM